jgi:hypothetical protein
MERETCLGPGKVTLGTRGLRWVVLMDAHGPDRVNAAWNASWCDQFDEENGYEDYKVVSRKIDDDPPPLA